MALLLQQLELELDGEVDFSQGLASLGYLWVHLYQVHSESVGNFLGQLDLPLLTGSLYRNFILSVLFLSPIQVLKQIIQQSHVVSWFWQLLGSRHKS